MEVNYFAAQGAIKFATAQGIVRFLTGNLIRHTVLAILDVQSVRALSNRR